MFLRESEATAATVLSMRKRSTATTVLSVRKRSDSSNGFVCAKAKRQQQRFCLCESEATATTDVGHEGVITGSDAFSLRTSIANPQRIAQPPLQSTYRFIKCA
ncbi:hypothetical protein C7Y47_21320 [Lysinibacillus sphaericus]|uniref:Uncharacterized protein n=1 Tax=Lysinibacillus sphaericus TaxID=1421 RepID=A0A544U8R2_LYSSH|nr:hypothetical protein C7Y47_21320 [Lysinibacillus sp. SDF0037]